MIKSLTLFGKKVKVKTLSKSKMPEALGLCLYNDQEIHIRKGMPFETTVDTLIHECVHMVDHEMMIGLSEEQVTKLGTGIAHLLLSNPALVDLVTDGRDLNP